ncbi:MAG: hypothetical protein IJS29_03340, partial [Selenomonadaceae bacterium]|nr:hypothetical protein [Selenomonadaceae bacterium]
VSLRLMNWRGLKIIYSALIKCFSFNFICTHFKYFKYTMKKFFPAQIKFLNGNAGTLNQLVRLANLQIGEGKKIRPSNIFTRDGISAPCGVGRGEMF